VGVWFSAVYLGEHYIVDVIGGIVYASLAFFAAEKLIPYLQSRYANKITERASSTEPLAGGNPPEIA
jgi:membrane-associated phospholipid phosphatase